MDALLREWDGETVVIRHDKPTDSLIFIAVHSTRRGPAAGGTRMKHYDDERSALADALRLSEGMTYKFAVPGLNFGGGKAVISIPQNLEPQPRADLLRRHGALIHQLGGLFSTGPDVGTSAEDMDLIAEAGAPHVFCRTAQAGGSGSPAPYTARGVLTGIETACEHAFGDASLNGRRILVQGVGSVGRVLIDLLREAGAEVSFSEIDEQTVRSYRDEQGLPFVPEDQLYATECDVFAPCALGGILNSVTIPQLRCRVVAGAANNQLGEPEDAERLRRRNILYAPDYVVNVGGAMGAPGIEILGWTPEETYTNVAESVRRALRQIFETAEGEGITTDAAARRIAEGNLRADS